MPPRLIPERPRSISGSRKNVFQGFGKPRIVPFGNETKSKDDEEDPEGDDPIPFTVIRVSSSVSQVRPEFQVEKQRTKSTSLTTSTLQTTERTSFFKPQRKFR